MFSSHLKSMGRDSNSSSNPYFFEFLKTDEDCSSKFQIPHEFVEVYGENLPQFVTLRIHESEKSWTVGIEKIGGNYYFTDDWKRFAEEVVDVNLQDYLIFNFHGLSEASSKELTLCNKDFSSGGDGHDKGLVGKAKAKNKDDAYEYGFRRQWSFVKELNENNAIRLGIPKKFVFGTGIATDRRLVLVDARGKKWPVRVTDGNRGQFAMTSGWHDFLEGNKVAVGSTISFEFISSSENLVKTRILEKNVKRGRGSPRLFALVKRHDKARGCTKAIKSKEEQDNDGEPGIRDDLSSKPKVAGVGSKWRFVKELKRNNTFMMDIPRDFAIGTGIGAKEKIKLRVAKGRIWPVGLRLKKHGVVAMTAGWKDFLVGNKLRVGSIILFEFDENTRDNIVKVRLLDKGGRGNELFETIKQGR